MTVSFIAHNCVGGSFHAAQLEVVASAEVVEPLNQFLRHVFVCFGDNRGGVDFSLNLVVDRSVGVGIADDDGENVVKFVADVVENIGMIASISVTWLAVCDQEQNIFSIFNFVLFMAKIFVYFLQYRLYII